MRQLGWTRYIYRSDGDYSLVASKNAVRDAMPDVEMTSKENLVGNLAANGEAENAVKEIKTSNSHMATATRCKRSIEKSYRRRL